MLLAATRTLPAPINRVIGCFWDTCGLPEGPCTVRVTATARSGQTREAACNILIDWQTPPGYGLWIARNEPTVEDLGQMRPRRAASPYAPASASPLPVYKTPIASTYPMIESVMDQTYPNLGAMPGRRRFGRPGACGRPTAIFNAMLAFARHCLEENRGISGATNAALRLCTGEYVAFLDHDDALARSHCPRLSGASMTTPDTDLFYSDEDKIDEQGRRYDAFFKPDWSPDLFRSCNYVCHFVVMRRSLAESLGGLDETYSGSQDYEFLLRASERTQKIRRIPKILYHWRAVAGSAAKAPEEKPEASADGKRALGGVSR
jgi:O-antigen biosynthesis protein